MRCPEVFHCEVEIVANVTARFLWCLMITNARFLLRTYVEVWCFFRREMNSVLIRNNS